jgi:hypothetical protein
LVNKRIPQVRSGDSFIAGARYRRGPVPCVRVVDPSPCACLGGPVFYLGVETEEGEEQVISYPCKRCEQGQVKEEAQGE